MDFNPWTSQQIKGYDLLWFNIIKIHLDFEKHIIFGGWLSLPNIKFLNPNTGDIWELEDSPIYEIYENWRDSSVYDTP